MKLILATRNKNKSLEIKEKLKNLKGMEILSLDEADKARSFPETIEDGNSFEENASKKARAAAEFFALPAMADDSGLCVAALGGIPGIFSARYGGENVSDAERNAKLLAELAALGSGLSSNREAKFVCAIALAFPDGELLTVRGECAGLIADEPSGGGGFGYDPIFFLPEYGCTMAKLPLEEKNRISHRACALDKARALLAERIGPEKAYEKYQR